MNDGHNGFEQMTKFFDRRVETYEAHMQEIMPTFHEFYSVANQIPVHPRPQVRHGIGARFRFPEGARIMAVVSVTRHAPNQPAHYGVPSIGRVHAYYILA